MPTKDFTPRSILRYWGVDRHEAEADRQIGPLGDIHQAHPAILYWFHIIKARSHSPHFWSFFEDKLLALV